MITVLTATYNRAHTLTRLYESLSTQADTDFIWLIVDDGSSDETAQLIESFIASSAINIVYLRKANGGKHSALNTGVESLSDGWVLIVDSDDALAPHAIANIRSAICEQSSRNYAGLCFRKAFFDGKVVGRDDALSRVRKEMLPAKAGEIFRGDLAYMFRVKVIKKYLFPIIPGENFVPELYIWNKVAEDGGVFYYGDLAIYCCEYLEGGYSAGFESNLRRNPLGFLIFYVSQIRREPTWLRKLKCIIRVGQCLVFASRRS
ncbi:hypothetical protein BVH03_02555 [Pseudomonas sp. PA15(2017)]|uniref:glycosyltransferase family A protein n=1 Tax=Pseudomonas sp. PA15(2017) TaxID=1932111 RepID=UPI0009592DD9|nr:glycosyltransferase family A protein [Pseudomonas sp. PA15(2017)]OLU34312.1 hypothetical protein BVH03_02555 [Pseudomonas sp. PA15(2017)]